MNRRNALFATFVSLFFLAPRETVGQTWELNSSAHWRNGTSEGVSIEDGRLRQSGKNAGKWVSSWHDWGLSLSAAEINVRASVNTFANKSIEVIVSGQEEPYTDRVGVPHDWYGRCMIAILDENRWLMAIRSGIDHIQGQGRDAIHVLTSDDEGRTWGGLNRWFDGTAIEGMPFDDGHIHSEPGIYRMPNGDLILQFWRSGIESGTRQFRSEDNGRTWRPDIDQINIEGLTGADGSSALGTQDYFVDPENPTDTYMAFQFFRYNSMSGSLLARSQDNGASYEFVSWIGPLARIDEQDSGATFEPGIEYIGNRTIIAVMRDGAGNRHTWQSVSRDMGESFSPLVDISGQINAGIDGGHWKRPSTYLHKSE